MSTAVATGLANSVHYSASPRFPWSKTRIYFFASLWPLVWTAVQEAPDQDDDGKKKGRSAQSNGEARAERRRFRHLHE
jgi:hypothetical protein